MSTSKLLSFLLLVTLVFTTPLTQQEVDTFIRENNFISPSTILNSFNEDSGKSIITYKDGPTSFKFIVAQNPQGKPYIVFREQMTQINFSNNQVFTPSQFGQINFIPMPFMDMQTMRPAQELQLIPIPPPMGQRFDHNLFSGAMPQQHMNIQKHFNFADKPKMPCRINDEDVKNLLKQNLVIFKNAEVKNIKKVGFQKGNGIILEISLTNDDKKEYFIKAGYMPRWRKLHILKVQEVKAQATPLDIGKGLIGKVISKLPENPVKQFQSDSLNLENIIQSFVEKLLVRRNFADIKPDQQVEQPTEKPLILGSQGEKQMNAPFLLGSQGELENKPVQEQPKQEKVQKPLLLGGQGEPQNPFRFETQNENLQQGSIVGAEENVQTSFVSKEEHHKEENSQEISELVTEVLEKLKLKTK